MIVSALDQLVPSPNRVISLAQRRVTPSPMSCTANFVSHFGIQSRDKRPGFAFRYLRYFHQFDGKTCSSRSGPAVQLAKETAIEATLVSGHWLVGRAITQLSRACAPQVPLDPRPPVPAT